MISPMEEWEGEIDGKKAKFGRPGFEPLSNESTALNIEEAIRLNASVLAVQVPRNGYATAPNCKVPLKLASRDVVTCTNPPRFPFSDSCLGSTPSSTPSAP